MGMCAINVRNDTPSSPIRYHDVSAIVATRIVYCHYVYDIAAQAILYGVLTFMLV